MSAREKIFKYLKRNGPGEYTGRILGEIANIRDWPRTLRQLKQDEIIDYNYHKGQDIYKIIYVGEYKVSIRNNLTSKDRYRIRHRDGHRCQSCGKGANDNVILHVDHKIPINWGGNNSDSNLWTLCMDCNLAKKSFFKDDFNEQVMKLVMLEKSGYQKLKVLFENSPGKKFPPSILQGISGIRDWTRSIRDIRKTHKINIQWAPPEKDFPDGYYVNIINPISN
jgi:hypothetical protein